MPDVFVVGSANADLIVAVPARPGAGQTILGGELRIQPGGKGANQAAAAARLGGDVTLCGCVGEDSYGDLLGTALADAGVDTALLRRVSDTPTGVALITVTPDGENSIVVAPGANAALSRADIDAAAEVLAASAVCVLQMEISADVIGYALERSAAAGVRTVLNAAPPGRLPDSAWSHVDVLVVNEHEAAVLAGAQVGAHDGASADRVVHAARALSRCGPPAVVVTLGAAGAVAVTADVCEHLPAPSVDVLDTTGAGDAFVGALALELARERPLPDAVRFAVRVGATSVTKPGAQPSYPTRDEVVPG